jgi:hypothetical protein
MTSTATQTVSATPSTGLASLTRLQRLFVEHLYTANCRAPAYSRKVLRELAIKGGWQWAPAWIVKDTSRKSSRGYYAIPELTELVNGMANGTETLSATAETIRIAQERDAKALAKVLTGVSAVPASIEDGDLVGEDLAADLPLSIEDQDALDNAAAAA